MSKLCNGEMGQLRNGELWKQTTHPFNSRIVQWIDMDQWMLMSVPVKSRHGWVATYSAVVEIDKPAIMTSEEALTILTSAGYLPTERGGYEQ